MGATVTTGKKASAFVQPDGAIVYILFESTYEKNCSPHTSHWGCIAIGYYEDVLQRIFLHASSCEGGMLQSRSGHIKPENYIAAWQRELAAPTEMPNVAIQLKSGSSLYSTIPSSRLEETRIALTRLGRLDAFEAILVGEVSVCLHDDIALILAVYGVKGPLAPWRILAQGECLTAPQPHLAAPVRNGSMSVLPARVYKLDDQELVVQIGAAPWQHGGWSYSVVGNYVTDVAYALELQKTGSAKRSISEFRDLCESAPPLPDGTRVQITRSSADVNKWNLDQADKLATALGLIAEGQPAPETFACTLADVIAANALYSLVHLNKMQVMWDVPVETEAGLPSNHTSPAA
jgi:hypothetical protein